MKQIRIVWWSLMWGSLLCCGAIAGAAETNSIRLAIGPFFAPAGNVALEKAASELPDLLAALLPQDGRFQLVERDKVTAIWNELHLAQAGLTSADTVIKLGRILSCDWLVSGSFVKTESGTQIWVKVINTQDSVVMDLQSVPYVQDNITATADAIASFLGQARSRERPREFIALGRFNDYSISSTHEDWSQRLLILLEKHFLAAGYGVVERDAVAPIFAEYQFQAAGHTGDSTNQVKLKPAFWIVDGGCKWIHDTQDKLSVTIRIQKMGGGEQEFLLAQPPGEELEKAVLDTVQSALAGTGSPTLEQAQAGEEKMRAEHLANLLQRHDEPPLLSHSTNQTFITVTNVDGQQRQVQVDTTFREREENHVNEYYKTLQQAILLNPNDMHAKFVLGRALFGSKDDAKNKQGEGLLEEAAASGDAIYATRAKNWLDYIRSGKLSFFHSKPGTPGLVTHGQPASFPPASFPVIDSNAVARGRAELKARDEKLFEAKNLATPSESMVQIPTSAFNESGLFGETTVFKLWKRIVFFGCGATLYSYDLDVNSIHEVGLPMKLKNSISAIEADTGVLWLGTSDGLFRISLADGTVREYTEKDGFPTPAITALRLVWGHLFIGFDGAFGYLNTGSGKFTGLMAGISLRQNWLHANQTPPASRVCSITTHDGNNFWVSSAWAFQHFDYGLNKWDPAMPQEAYADTGTGGLLDQNVAINSKFLVTENYQHCFSVCALPGTNWMSVNLKTNSTGMESSAIALDQANHDWLWIGDNAGGITLVDLPTLKIIAKGQIPKSPAADIRWIIPTADKVVIATREEESYYLRSLDKSTLFEKNPEHTSVKLNEITNLAVRSEHLVPTRTNPGLIACLNDGPITACSCGSAFGKGQLLVASGTSLKSFDWSGMFGPGSGTDFEKVDLPLKVEYPITAIASDEQNLWLGTDGGGLMHFQKSGATPTIFNEKDGFPMASIRSLALTPDRLFIGFGRGMDGAFGYLDTSTLKFTGTKSSGITLKMGEESLQPPPRHSVWQIKSPDGTNIFWIASASALYRLNFNSQEWSLQLPTHNQSDYPQAGGFRTLATDGDYIATIMASGGIGIYKVSADRWTHLNLSTNRTENDVTTVAIELAKPNYLWLGGHGKITIMDMETQKIVCEHQQDFRDGPIEFIVVYPADIFFIEESSGVHELFHWEKPNY